MEKARKVKDYIKEINKTLESMMSETFHGCKDPNPEVSKLCIEINTKAHKCSTLLKRLDSTYRSDN